MGQPQPPLEPGRSVPGPPCSLQGRLRAWLCDGVSSGRCVVCVCVWRGGGQKSDNVMVSWLNAVFLLPRRSVAQGGRKQVKKL